MYGIYSHCSSNAKISINPPPSVIRKFNNNKNKAENNLLKINNTSNTTTTTTNNNNNNINNTNNCINNGKKNNKFFMIMFAIVKVKKLEIKAKQRLRKLSLRKKSNSYTNNNKIIFIKEPHRSDIIYIEPLRLTYSYSNFSSQMSTRSAATNTTRSTRSNLTLPPPSIREDEEIQTISQNDKTETIKNKINNGVVSLSRKHSTHLKPLASRSSLALSPSMKYNYNLKHDIIYGDKKLKMTGKHVLPEQLPKDLRNINKLVELTKSMNLNEDDGEQSTDTQSTTSTIRHSQTYQMVSKTQSQAVPKQPQQQQQQQQKDKVKASAKPKKNYIPTFVQPMNDLLVLDLSSERQSCLNFPLIQIPFELFKLKQLRRLHFDCNKIKQLPDEFGVHMINLETLTISNNRLKSLPATFKHLQKLQSLHLSHNKFDTFPEILCEMENLRFLDLSINNITEIPDDIDNLENLESLLLFHNNIKELPSSIGNLVQLRTLWLGENRLKQLPRSICNLKHLDWTDDQFNLSSNLAGNPLETPPISVCLKGIESIRDYFNRQHYSSTDSDYQMSSNASNNLSEYYNL